MGPSSREHGRAAHPAGPSRAATSGGCSAAGHPGRSRAASAPCRRPPPRPGGGSGGGPRGRAGPPAAPPAAGRTPTGRQPAAAAPPRWALAPWPWASGAAGAEACGTAFPVPTNAAPTSKPCWCCCGTNRLNKQARQADGESNACRQQIAGIGGGGPTQANFPWHGNSQASNTFIAGGMLLDCPPKPLPPSPLPAHAPRTFHQKEAWP